MEEQRQADRLQRQLQQERAYLVSLQQQQQQQQQDSRPEEKKQLYHYKDAVNPSDKPAWAKKVSSSEIRLNLSSFFQNYSVTLFQGWSDKFLHANMTFWLAVNNKLQLHGAALTAWSKILLFIGAH